MSETREIAVCGMKAVSAVFARRSDCVIRLFFDPPTGRRIGSFCKLMAESRRVYRQLPARDLAKVAGTVHHGGVVAITQRETPAEITRTEIGEWSAAQRSVVILDRVSNPHNLGALVRSAAFFGVSAVVFGAHRDQAFPGEAAYRIAEGGMEHVELRWTESLPRFLRGIRPDYVVCGAAMQGDPLDRVRIPAGGKSRRRPVALVLGNEEAGLAPPVLAACEHKVLIPGAGPIESLNVSAAGAVLMHWFFGRESSLVQT